MQLTRRSAVFSLAAALVPKAAAAMAAPLAPYPLLHKEGRLAPGRLVSQTNRSKALDPQILQLLRRVDGARIFAHVRQLQEFKTRHSLSGSMPQVATWLRTRLSELSGDPSSVRFQAFQMPEGPRLDNVLRFPRADRRFVLVGAHYDSTSENPGVLAPGADDNASGIALLLELAAVLKEADLQRGVLLAAFAGEEQGLFGSQACAEIAARENWPIDLVINLDMVGHFAAGGRRRIVVEFDQGNAQSGNDAAAKAFALQMAQLAVDYADLEVEHTDIWSSDYMPFEARGFPCVGLYDGAGDADFYHRGSDTTEHISEAGMTAVAKLMVSSLASICGLRRT